MYGVSLYVHIYSHKVSNFPTTCQQRNRTGNKLFLQPWEADAVAATSPVLQMMLKFREVHTLIQSHTELQSGSFESRQCVAESPLLLLNPNLSSTVPGP